MLQKAIGMITPSSNTVVERVTQTIISGLDDCSAHFARIPIFGNHFETTQADAYDDEAMRSAAELLSHARTDVICWNGTKGATLGFNPDRELCDQIFQATGISTVTTALATLEVLHQLGISRFALITPLSKQKQLQLINSFQRQGLKCVSEKHLSILDNYDCSRVAPVQLAQLVRMTVQESQPEAVLIFCTNFYGLPVVSELEAELNIPVLDSASIGVWAALRTIEADTYPIKHHGRLFTV